MGRVQSACYVRRLGAILGLTLVASACGEGTRNGGAEAVPPIPQTDATEPAPGQGVQPLPPESIPERPRTVVDTLLLEGMPEPSRSTLVEAPADFPVRFSTYVPEGIGVDFEGAGDSAGVRFHANFAGRADRNAYMQVRIYGAGTTRTQASSAATDFVRSRAPAADEMAATDVPPWGVEAFTFSYRGDGNVPVTGRLVLGLHGDRFFHVLTHYPAEYGDGLGPRFDRILRHWRWEDTGRPLVPR